LTIKLRGGISGTLTLAGDFADRVNPGNQDDLYKERRKNPEGTLIGGDGCIVPERLRGEAGGAEIILHCADCPFPFGCRSSDPDNWIGYHFSSRKSNNNKDKICQE
jgi:hypothetical protein